MMTNRRRSTRILVDLPLQWKRGRQTVKARIVDINEDGMFIETEQTIAPNQLIELTIDLPTGPVSISAVTKICGLTKRGVGIGASIFAMEPRERFRWNHHYRRALERAAASLGADVGALVSAGR